MKRLFAAFIVLLIALFVLPLWTMAAPPPESDRVPAQILVKFKAGTPQTIIDAQLRSHNAKIGVETTLLNIICKFSV